MANNKLAIIGGSGLYDVEEFKERELIDLNTPWGKPSDQILKTNYKNKEVYFLPRHGRGHFINPSNINFRANIDALKQLGVTDIVSVSAVGSLKEDLPPGKFVIVDQFIDRTFARNKTFFDDDIVAHVPISDPTCINLKQEIIKAANKSNINIIEKSTYICIEGPQFSTKSESFLYKKWGADIVGMTSMPEVKLSREAEICYVNLSLITDFDCWNDKQEPVSAKIVINNFQKNINKIHSILKKLSLNEDFLHECNRGCQNSLENSITTKLDRSNKKNQNKLKNIIKKYYNII